jgi:hypothetical protein
MSVKSLLRKSSSTSGGARKKKMCEQNRELLLRDVFTSTDRHPSGEGHTKCLEASQTGYTDSSHKLATHLSKESTMPYCMLLTACCCPTGADTNFQFSDRFFSAFLLSRKALRGQMPQALKFSKVLSLNKVLFVITATLVATNDMHHFF